MRRDGPADVVVVGAGPAGIVTAIAASLQGLQVTVLDSRKPPIDKPCGEGLLPEAVAALRRVGIELNSSFAFPFSGIRFCDEASSATARIAQGQAFGLRRTALHRLLEERALELGVRFEWGARICDLSTRGVTANGKFVPCSWLVGADGQNSTVRRWARLGPDRYRRSRFGFRRHYAAAPWTDAVEVHWGRRCQMFVTPTGTNEVCIALLSNNPHLRIDGALAQFPAVASHLRDVPAEAEGGAITALGRARAVARGNVALVGDASCAIDGIAGQGLSLAFQEAVCLGEALARNELRAYEAAHQRIAATAVRMTQLLLLMERSAWIREKTLRLFASQPALFSKMMSIHTGESSPESLRAREIAGLGLRVLLA
jgi:flavin-dependent dehydrogenase